MRILCTVLLCLCYFYGAAQHAKIVNITSEAKNKIGNNTFPDIVESPFELVDRLIFVNAEIEGRSSDFILDTGAPLLIINSNNIRADKNSVKAIGVSGTIQANSIFVENFKWKGLRQESFYTYAIDISHLEKLTRRDIGGLIGFDAFKEYELMIDYANRVIKMYKQNASVYHNNILPKDSIPFFLYDHFPVVEVELEGRKYHFGLDSGAEFNLVDDNLKEDLKKWLQADVEEIELYGADKSVKTVTSVNVKNTNIAGNNYTDMEYVFTDISHLNDDKKILDGLLGYPFLSSRLFSINVQQQMIYIW